MGDEEGFIQTLSKLPRKTSTLQWLPESIKRRFPGMRKANNINSTLIRCTMYAKLEYLARPSTPIEQFQEFIKQIQDTIADQSLVEPLQLIIELKRRNKYQAVPYISHYETGDPDFDEKMIAAIQNLTSVMVRSRWRLLKFAQTWGDCDWAIATLFEAEEPAEILIPFIEDVLRMNIVIIRADGGQVGNYGQAITSNKKIYLLERGLKFSLLYTQEDIELIRFDLDQGQWIQSDADPLVEMLYADPPQVIPKYQTSSNDEERKLCYQTVRQLLRTVRLTISNQPGRRITENKNAKHVVKGAMETLNVVSQYLEKTKDISLHTTNNFFMQYAELEEDVKCLNCDQLFDVKLTCMCQYCDACASQILYQTTNGQMVLSQNEQAQVDFVCSNGHSLCDQDAQMILGQQFEYYQQQAVQRDHQVAICPRCRQGTAACRCSGRTSMNIQY